MPKKYHIHIKSLPPQFEPISAFSTIESKNCLRCRLCVRDEACVYHVNRKRGFDSVQVLDPGDSACMGCMRCVQECKANILTRARNSRFDAMGDDYWKPDIIAKIWNQAETGKIPVSGAGYRGPFSGPGFDQMWTDMSEIVRPTRDGIHGREYISTLIELGRKPRILDFTSGQLRTDAFPLHELQLPIILDIPTIGIVSESVRQAIASAAANLSTLAVAEYGESVGTLSKYRANLITRIDPQKHSLKDVQGSPIIELAYSDTVMKAAAQVKEQSPKTIVSIRLPLDDHAVERASALARAGAEVIHLQASPKGRGLDKRRCDFVTHLIREVHLRLVSDAIREQLTLLVSGGIAQAEHVAKIILCGADGVGVDLALMAAMECRLCRECSKDIECPVKLETIPLNYGTQRIVNLIGSWHSQLIELMGAMGIREVRRLRGEVGRAMFFDDLERENFAPIFGQRIQSTAVGVSHTSIPSGNGAQRDFPALSESQTFPLVKGLVQNCPTRYRNRFARYKVIYAKSCTTCGKCVQVCKFGVHEVSGKRMMSPKTHLCVGADVCREKGAYCGDHCPENAIRVGPDPVWQTIGDPRWTADLIVSTWMQAETGMPPTNGLEYKVGASGGGFDRMDFAFPENPKGPGIKAQEIDLSLPLNRRHDDNRPRITIGFPGYSGGMSFGSVNLAAMVAKARAYTAFDSFTCTGEGGYPDALLPYNDHVITQIATGLFGVREETIQRVRMVEFKYAQGAKPGLGGHLLGDKVTPAVAKIRESVVGNALFSPFPFHSVYSIEDHKKHLDWVKAINPTTLVSVKVSSPNDVDMVAVGSYYAGAHIIHIDGSYGGTGAAPDIAKKNIAMPIEYAIPKVHKFLEAEGVRDQMTLIASGGIRSAWDIAKIIALGADGVVLGTSEMVAIECIRCGRCESGRGCPRGIATTDTELAKTFGDDWATQRLINLLNSYAVQLQAILWQFGMKSIRELVGRSDLLTHQDYSRKAAPALIGTR